jgi:hypothetical protein
LNFAPDFLNSPRTLDFIGRRHCAKLFLQTQRFLHSDAASIFSTACGFSIFCGERVGPPPLPQGGTMESNFAIEIAYRMEGHDTLGWHDTDFYRTLPNYRETYRERVRDEITGNFTSHEIPQPRRSGAFEIISVVGSALLSSSVLATLIKAWLQSSRTKITITQTSSKTELTFEGPDLRESEETIQSLLESMRDKSPVNRLRVLAEHLPPP